MSTADQGHDREEPHAVGVSHAGAGHALASDVAATGGGHDEAHEGHGHGADTLGPIDWQAWGAGGQTGIYPMETPGGWRILGRTPVRPFDESRTPPVLFAAGDRVRFRAIDRDAFDRMSR